MDNLKLYSSSETKIYRGLLTDSFVEVRAQYDIQYNVTNTHYIVKVPLDSVFNLEDCNNDYEPIYFCYNGFRYNITNILEKCFGNTDNIMFNPIRYSERYILDDINISVDDDILIIERTKSLWD